MLEELQTFIAKHHLIAKNEKILLAVSGGKDSICMAHLFRQLDYPFSIAHCNFKLRELDSESDENFVKDLAAHWNVPFFSKTFDTSLYASQNGLSIQMAARELRYKWFKSLCMNKGFDKILTAHHQDDAIETLLIKKSRKASIGALRGVPLKNDNIIRPMLCFSVKQIEDFLLSYSINYRKDKSNDSTYYLRNSIRKDLKSIDALTRRDYLNEIDDNTKKYNELIVKTEEYKKEFCFEKNGGTFFSFEFILNQHDKNEILYECLKYYGPFSWKDVFALIDAEVGKFISNSTYRIVRERKGLFLSKESEKNEQIRLICKNDDYIDYPISLKFSVSKISVFRMINDSQYSMLDYDKLHFPLTLRKWKVGDSFKPLGMKGRKKISDFMIDEKFSSYQKENTFVICSLNKIVCIVGHRINDDFKLVAKTEKVYLVEPLKIEHGK